MRLRHLDLLIALGLGGRVFLVAKLINFYLINSFFTINDL